MKILFATQNQSKLSEARSILAPANVELISVDDLKAVAKLTVEETGTTFQENAQLKAQAFSRLAQMMVFADDSGLEIDALDGLPGVRSDRWIVGTTRDKNQAVLDKLKGIKQRRARFVTVICLLNPQTNKIMFFEGEIKGEIAVGQIGSEGFGYDSIFIPQGHKQTFAELGVRAKNKLSHRGKALRKMAAYLTLLVKD